MKKSFKNYFTTGELSKCCQILRKTLLYYDKENLISPAVILENGYRYYNRAQLFMLELIITLRQLKVPMCSIKDYLEHRSLHNYKQLLQERQWHCQQEILHLQQINFALEKYLEELNKLETIPYGQIREINCPEQYLVVSKGAKVKDNFKTRTAQTAYLFSKLRKELPFKQHYYGYIFDKKTLSEGKKHYSKEYFYPISHPLDNIICQLRPAGVYLTMYFKGTYMHNSYQALTKLAAYCQEKHLKPISDIYVTSLLNYWTTENNQDYAYKIEVCIK